MTVDKWISFLIFIFYGFLDELTFYLVNKLF